MLCNLIGNACKFTPPSGRIVVRIERQESWLTIAVMDSGIGIAEAAQASTQIAASSQQQLVGMDQVAMAMENVKTASAQNAEAAKQMETATHNISELGGKLKEMVSWYRITA